MSTRSVIARQEGDTWRGRYVHWDGYPSAKVPELLELVPALGGYEQAVEFLTEKHFSWSSLDGHPDQCRAHDDGNAEDWILADGDDWGTEWAYVLASRGFTVLQRVHDNGAPATGYFGCSAADGGGWLNVGFVRYDTDPATFDLTPLECGADFERCKHIASYHFPEAEGTRYGTDTWLGQAEVSFNDASEVEFANGVRRVLTGSGGTSTADRPMEWEELRYNPKRPRYWWASVRPPEDVDRSHAYDERVARIVKAGYKLEHALVFPPTAVRGELVVPAGTVIERG